MLAVKLHQNQKPPLHTESYLIPILDWDSGRILIKHWLSHLNRVGGKEMNAVRYVTLVKVPDDHLVSLCLTPTTKVFVQHSFMRLADIPIAQKAEFTRWYKELAHTSSNRHPENLPELILGEPLSDKYVKWTKRVQLLYGREENVKSRKFGRR